MNYTDEKLNAYLDGELDLTEMEEIRDALYVNPSLSERLEELVLVDSFLKTQYSKIDSKPIPIKLIDTLSEPHLPLNKKHRTNQFINYSVFIIGILGMLTIFIGFNELTPTNPTAVQPQILLKKGFLSPESELSKILEDSPSSTNRALGGNGKQFVMPVLSFKSIDNQFCREFIVSDESLSQRSLACKNSLAGWEIKLISVDAQKGHGIIGYQTASSISSSTFEQYVNIMILEDPLSLEEEISQISKGWQ